MNQIDFLRTTMTTVMISVKSSYKPNELLNLIPLDYSVLGDINILALYYKNSNGKIEIVGTYSATKVFPKTLVIICKRKDKTFKIRWFYSKPINTLHLASGFKQEYALKILDDLILYIKSKSQNKNIEIIDTKKILSNGMAQAKIGINLKLLCKSLDKSKSINYVYTPDTHASLKIYTEYGTACVHSTGKILYMGCKDTLTLMKLHDYISDIGKHWSGIRFL